MKSIQSFMSSVGLTVLSILFCLTLFEIVCRIFVDDGMHYHLEMWKYAIALKAVADDPAVGHVHVPGAQARLMGVDVRINDDGLREESSVGAAEGDALRVLMLGDSVTFGWGVPQSETVSERLEQQLTNMLGRPVDVLNAGVGNYNTAMEAAWFERQGLAYAPDVVVLNVFINDAEETPAYQTVAWWDRLLFSRVILFGGVDTVRRTVFGGEDWRSYYRNLYDDQAAGWQAMQTAFRRLNDLTRETQIPLVVVDYPELRELDPYPFADVSQKIEALAVASNVPYVSLLPAVQDYDPQSLWVTRPDPHPNTRAVAHMSDYLAPRLLEILRADPRLAR